MPDVPRFPLTVDALLSDASFLAWLEGHAEPGVAAQWEAWAAATADHGRLAAEARALMEHLQRPADAAPGCPDVDAEWRRLAARLDAVPPRRRRRRPS